MKNAVPAIITHPCTLIRDGLRQIFVGTEFDVVYAAQELDDAALPLVASSPTSIWLLAVDECQSSTLALMQHVKELIPNIKPVILTRFKSADDILPALEAGACGFLSQDITRERLIKSLELIVMGETVAPVELYQSQARLNKMGESTGTKNPSQSAFLGGAFAAGGSYNGMNGPANGNVTANGYQNGGRPNVSSVTNGGHATPAPTGPQNGQNQQGYDYAFDGDSEPAVKRGKGSSNADLICSLSKRETSILRRLMEGASNKVIARQLVITEATVKVHIKAILRKLRLHNRTQAAIWASEHLVAKDTEAQPALELEMTATAGEAIHPRLSS